MPCVLTGAGAQVPVAAVQLPRLQVEVAVPVYPGRQAAEQVAPLALLLQLQATWLVMVVVGLVVQLLGEQVPVAGPQTVLVHVA